jgi:hypothetical protein
MGTKLRYKPGSFYRVDDLTGFPERAEATKKTWQGYFVRTKSWEPRNAQDFVRGRRDDQTVPEPRPRQTNIFLGYSTTLAVSAPIQSTTIYPATWIPVAVGNVLTIILEDGSNFFVAVVAVGGDYSPDFNQDFLLVDALGIAQPLPQPAANGALVTNTAYAGVQPQSYPGGGVS